MNDKVKGLVLGLTIGVMLTGSIAYASGSQIEVYFKNIKYMFDGYEKNPTLEQGEGFIYNGTTYVPLRYISETLGKEVQWDGDTETIWVGKKADLNAVVATYQGGQVTRGAFEKYLAITLLLNPDNAKYENDEAFKSYMLKQMIGQHILASRLAPEVKASLAATIEQNMVDLNNYLQSKGDTKALLTKGNVVDADLRSYVDMVISAQKALEASVTEEDLKALYATELSNKNENLISASVRHILINANDEKGVARTKEALDLKLKEIQDKLKSGEDFVALAKQYSEDPGSKENGGLYADASVVQWVDGFKQAVISQELNKVGEPVQTEFGYHIIRVESRGTLSFDSVKEGLKQSLVSERTKQYNEKDLPALIQSITLPKP
ncbi:peptidylprolyl isomerase [Paenibacillus agricola]|uniref:Peptidylprolyl isomerase n=1 Tax=Paenibacillus agricola TaxID=2716264 RepID=A0ABX0J4H5_9BACL|nr:peptidylprolyl isomerase [Paenibacillus agricola]NHN30878.1 peptidylprolyl isomerase [Paenibacillus agricola]